MKRARFVFIALAALTLACSFVSNIFNPQPTPTEPEPIFYGDCPGPQPTQADVDLSIEHADKYFGSEWKMNYGVMDYRVSVTRKNDDLNAVANFDYVTFCNVTNAALDDYYNPENFEIIFQYYDDYESQTDCQTGNLRLYEFEMQNDGFDYNGRFWVEILDQHHTRETLLVFPVEDTDNMDSYSKKIAPDLPACK